MTTSRQPAARGSAAAGDGSSKTSFAPSDRPNVSAHDVAGSVAGFGENVLSLTELQARLAALELRQNLQAAKRGGALMCAGLILAGSSLPVAMAGAAELLVSALQLQRGFALLGVAGVVFTIGGLLVKLGGLWLRHERLGFPLSAEELTRNFNWIRAVLRHSGRSPLQRS
jgi:hypothetical protein